MNSTHSSAVSTPDSPRFSRTDSSKSQDTNLTRPSSGGVKSPSIEVSPASSKSPCQTSSHHQHSHHHHRSSTRVAPKIVYGAGAVSRLPTELGQLSLSAPLIVSSPSRLSLARRVQALIPNLDTRILDSALVNVPQRVVDDAVGRVTGRDSVISVGGASAIRLAKAIASRKGIPHICIPTTYAGSESPLLGDVRRRKSRYQRYRNDDGTVCKRNNEDDTQTMPEMIIYDEDLTSTTTSMTISAPNDSVLKSSGRSSMDDDAQWSFIHLPGV